MKCSASAYHRQHLAVTLFKDTLESAWQREKEQTTETRRHREDKQKLRDPVSPCFKLRK